MAWAKPSAAGRRLAQERKWRLNVAHYGGSVKLITVTAPGVDLLPYGDDWRRGPTGVLLLDGNGDPMPLVEDIYRTIFNTTAQARMSRLMEAAQKAADRWVQRQGYGGQLPRQIGNVKAEQKRGIWHWHYVLPYESAIEKTWSRLVHRYIDNAWKRDLARWPDADDRAAMLWAEYAHNEVVRGFYGLGFVNARNPHGRSADGTARYAARNAAGYAARNVTGPNRGYVSSRLTRATGVTMRALRSVNYLHVRRKLIADGDLADEVVPSYWTPEWAAHVLLVESMCTAPRGP